MDEEKRAFKRISTKVIVNCIKDNDYPNAPLRFASFSKDLSCEGARIVCPKDIEPKDKFVMTVEIPTSFIPLMIVSEAIWVKKVDRPNWRDALEAGVKFMNIDPLDCEKLKSFIAVKENQLYRDLAKAQ